MKTAKSKVKHTNPNLRIVGAKALLDRGLVSTSVRVSGEDGVISDVGSDRNSARTIDARGLLLLPGIVDIHGDAFERQMMPRPGVHVALDIALIDSDKQAIANGIRQLPERDAMVLQLYFVEEMNLDEIGQTLGVGAARICQIKKAALDKLRGALSGWDE